MPTLEPKKHSKSSTTHWGCGKHNFTCCGCNPKEHEKAMTIQKTKEKLLEVLQKSKGDNEAIHGCYDDYIKAIAYTYEPELVEEADKLVEGISFWYA